MEASSLGVLFSLFLGLQERGRGRKGNGTAKVGPNKSKDSSVHLFFLPPASTDLPFPQLSFLSEADGRIELIVLPL